MINHVSVKPFCVFTLLVGQWKKHLTVLQAPKMNHCGPDESRTELSNRLLMQKLDAFIVVFVSYVHGESLVNVLLHSPYRTVGTPSPLHCRNSFTQQHLNDALRHFHVNKLVICSFSYSYPPSVSTPFIYVFIVFVHLL